jgi:F1F0 ATPase subunit 2
VTNTVFGGLPGALALAAIGLAVGLLAGGVHFASLRWNAACFATGRPVLALTIQFARLAVSAALFFALAKAGAFALLGGAAGFIWTRSISLALHRVEA